MNDTNALPDSLTDALQTMPVQDPGDPLFEVLAQRAVRRGRAVRARRRTAMVALPALVALAAGALTLPDRDPAATAAVSVADVALIQVAQVSEQRSAAPADAAFWFVASSGEQTMPDPDTGQLRTRTFGEQRTWLGRTAPSLYESDPLPGTTTPRRTAVQPYVLLSTDGKTRVDWDGLRQLPTDTASLLARLQAMFPSDDETGDLQLWRALGDLLASSPAPPDLRAGLYRVAARLDGVSTTSGVDSTGRPALIASYRYRGSQARSAYLIAPDDGMLLEQREYSGGTPGDGAPAGTLVGRITYRVSGPVPNTDTIL